MSSPKEMHPHGKVSFSSTLPDAHHHDSAGQHVPNKPVGSPKGMHPHDETSSMSTASHDHAPDRFHPSTSPQVHEKPAHSQSHPEVHSDDHTSFNPFSAPDVYYGQSSPVTSSDPKRRHFSAQIERGAQPVLDAIKQHRRGSQNAFGENPRQFLVPVDSTLKELLAQEDTSKKGQITIRDEGPKTLNIGTAASEGFHRVDVRGTYILSSLLQELTLAKDYGLREIVLDEQRLNENPVNRLNRFIRDIFWPNLTRCIDGANIGMVAKDPKDWTSDPRPRIYVPPGAAEQYKYYSEIANKHPDLRLDVQWLSPNVTPEYIRDLNSAPGLLAVAMNRHVSKTGDVTMKGKPFLVPGGRFNELYGWDSYMASLGLLLHDRVDLCKTMVENFCFCIEYYGKILNANRTYYLGRSQPPFLTDMTLRVYDRIRHEADSLNFLKKGILAAMKEFYAVWTASPRYDPKSGLSRYRPIGVGVPPETEATHFKHVLDPYARKHGISFEDFVQKYNHGVIKELQLDVYFLHDRAVRESGHDTSYRLEGVAADLATVDLNSCLYKVECDIARTLRSAFNGSLQVPPEFRIKGMPADFVESAATWDRRAKERRQAMDKYMWDENEGMYFDYNTEKCQATGYESATTFWAMWAGVATPRQAAAMTIKALPKFEELGGLASGTEKSRGVVGLHRPNRQWDYPFGWAPQQLLAWTGFERYGYIEEAQRLAYKWLFMVVNAFHNFNGVVVEKYDVTRPDSPHEVAAEYGNQGLDFKGIPREGFGWVNASVVVGLNIIDAHQRRALENLTPWEVYDRATKELAVDVPGEDWAPESEHLMPVRRKTGLSHEGIPSGEPIHSKGLGHLAHSIAQKVQPRKSP